MIIPAFWIAWLILNIPCFPNEKFERKISPNFYVQAWPEEWMPKAYYIMWFAVFAISFTIMVGLYSRVVYTSTRPAISCRDKSAKRDGVAIAIQNFEKRASQTL